MATCYPLILFEDGAVLTFEDGIPATYETGELCAVPTGEATGGWPGGSYDFLNPRRPGRIDDDEEEIPARRVVKIGEAPKPVVITGIVEKVPRSRAQNIDELKRIAALGIQADLDAIEARRKQIRRNNAYLMLS